MSDWSFLQDFRWRSLVVPSVVRLGVLGSALGACGGPSDLPPGRLTHSVDSLAVPPTNCGSSSGELTIDISNDAPSTLLRWSADVDGPFVLDGLTQGTLASFGKATLVLHAAVPSTAAAGLPLTGALRFHNNDPNEPVVTIPLSVTPRGATLIMPSSPVDFGDIPVSATSPSVVGSILNVGSAPAEILVGAPSDPQFAAQTKTLFVLPGSKEDVAMTFSPATWATVNASLPVTVKGPVCGALPTMPLQGKGTKGVVLTSPGSLDFGLVDCGATAGPKKVTVANQGDAAFDVDAVLGVGTSFTVAPTKATVPAGGSIELVVTPSAIPQTSAVTPDLYGDTLTLTTTALGDFPHVIALHETAHGAILDLTLPSTSIRSRVDDVKVVPVTFSNTGNASGTASLTTPNNALTITTAAALAGQTTTVNLEVRADPEKLGLDDAETLTWNTTAPICGTSVATGTVRAYDSVLDVSTLRYNSVPDVCVVGHTHRAYCWGNNDSGGLPFINNPAPTTPKLVVGETADQVALAAYAAHFRTGSTIRRIHCTQSTKTVEIWSLPPSFSSVMHSNGGGNFHWCAISAQGDLSCTGASGGGQLANGQCDFMSSTPLVAYPSVRPIQAYAGDEQDSEVISNGEVWTSSNTVVQQNPCMMGPPVKVGISDAVSVASGSSIGCAVRANGTVSCWTRSPVLSAPQAVSGLSDALNVVGGGDRFCALRANGLVSCWNGYALMAADLPGVVSPKRITTENGYVCAIKSDDSLACAFNGPFQPVVGFEGP